MSVLLETSLGDIVIDLFVDECPATCTNFLKLCKVKYYNWCTFFNVQRDLLIQTGDPDNTGKGGQSIWGLLSNDPNKRWFPAQIHPRRKHSKRGLVSMAVAGVDPDTGLGVSGSQFLITVAEKSEYLDGKCTIFGEVAEGLDIVEKINEVFTDDQGRPLQDILIKHTVILDDPFPDPPGLVEPDRSPDPPRHVVESVRLAIDERLDDELTEEERRKREAASHALALEMMGDLPFAEIRPPENVLFVCKLNPITRDEDLELIFGRFGEITSCEIIRDKVTNESLCYAFVEYKERSACEAAYFKMDNVLIDDRRIKVDFSQSVSKLHRDWVTARKQQALAAGYGGFSNLQRRTQYRTGDAAPAAVAGAGNDAALEGLVFEHDADLRGGQEVQSARHERELLKARVTSSPAPPPPRPRSPRSRHGYEHAPRESRDRHRSRSRSRDRRSRQNRSPRSRDRSYGHHQRTSDERDYGKSRSRTEYDSRKRRV